MPPAGPFSRLMPDRSATATPVPKALPRSVPRRIVAGDGTIRIIGSKKVLAGALTGSVQNGSF